MTYRRYTAVHKSQPDIQSLLVLACLTHLQAKIKSVS